MEDININDIKTGMVLEDNKNVRHVVIETNLNGDDDYYSSLRIISEEEYLRYKGKSISENEMETTEWIGKLNIGKDTEFVLNIMKK